MSGGGSGGEKSEKATPKRIKKARHDGQIGNSPELGTWVGLLIVSFLLPHLARALLDLATSALVQAAATIRSPDPARAMTAASSSVHAAVQTVLPLGVLVAGVSVASVAAQGALWFSPKLLKPNVKRLNPLSGMKRLFGPHALWALVKSLLKTGALAAAVYVSVQHLIPTLMGSGSMQLSTLVDVGTATALGVLRYGAAAGVALAVADFAVTKRRNNKSLKMTKQEIKEEHKSSEGDPHIRGMRRSRQMAMRRNRMMAEVATADVVVVNPTHVAVALRYEPQRGAPRVVAKGGDHVAARIRERAEQHRVPMVSDVPLARTLYKTCAVGQEIPPDLYRAVATVLAFIMTLKRRGSAAGTHTVRTLAPTR